MQGKKNEQIEKEKPKTNQNKSIMTSIHSSFCNAFRRMINVTVDETIEVKRKSKISTQRKWKCNWRKRLENREDEEDEKSFDVTL